jgi:23S rRNA (cytosine1962-C5)-methyltransferase
MDKLKPYIIEALKELFNPQTIYFKNDSAHRELENLPIGEAEIIGKFIYDLNIIENDLSYFVTLLMGQKTGWFYDHRENRSLIAKLAKDKTVIDYFCYSGGFSIQAAKHGAKKVIGVDRSESAIKNAMRTARLNKLDAQCHFIVDECFDDMDKRISEQQSFDIVILDPPAFVKSKKDLGVGLKGYEKLLQKGIQLTNKGGMLLIASCSYHVKEADLKNCLSTALNKQKRQGKIQKRLGAGYDHPLHPLLEESEYLKGFLVTL